MQNQTITVKRPGRLIGARVNHIKHSPSVTKREDLKIILDFDDDFHCALSLNDEMRKAEVADALLSLRRTLIRELNKGE